MNHFDIQNFIPRFSHMITKLCHWNFYRILYYARHSSIFYLLVAISGKGIFHHRKFTLSVCCDFEGAKLHFTFKEASAPLALTVLLSLSDNITSWCYPSGWDKTTSTVTNMFCTKLTHSWKTWLVLTVGEAIFHDYMCLNGLPVLTHGAGSQVNASDIFVTGNDGTVR